MVKRIKEGLIMVQEEKEKISDEKDEKDNNDDVTSREIKDVADGGEEKEVNVSVSKEPEASDDDEIYPLSLEEMFEIDEKEAYDDQDVTDYPSEEKIEEDEKKESGIQQPNVYFLSLVATDANDFRNKGKGVPRKCRYFFDVRSEMELENYGVQFLSAQDLELFYYEKQLSSGAEQEGMAPNIYQLAVFFIAHHPNDYHFIDEVPLLKGSLFVHCKV